MKVKATQRGWYDLIRQPGAEFVIRKPDDFSDKWMMALEPMPVLDAPAPAAPAPAAPAPAAPAPAAPAPAAPAPAAPAPAALTAPEKAALTRAERKQTTGMPLTEAEAAAVAKAAAL